MLPNLVYAALLIAVLLAPYTRFFGRDQGDNDRSSQLLVVVVCGLTAILIVVRGGFFPLAVVLLLPLIGLGSQQVIGGAAAVFQFSTVTWWWTPETRMSPLAIAAFVTLGVIGAFLSRCGKGALLGEERHTPLLLPMLACLLAGVVAGLITAPFGSTKPIFLAWHHWGAYISPVEAWLSGGLPYRDFPIQYGLGPTALLAATCGSDCWNSLYWIVIVANALYFASLAGSALILAAKLSTGIRLLALLALFCASFLWTGFPPDLSGPAMTPSVAGLRFLPISLLLLHILWAEQRRKRHDAIGHGLWLAGLFWSPEGAFFVTAIWWPYLALRNSEQATRPRQAFIALSRGGLLAAGALALGMGALAITVQFLSGGAARLQDFYAYILHPPGPLPIAPFGTIWLVLTVVLIAIVALAHTGSRSLYACLLGLLSGGAYYLSRSHDNNLLNLLPLIALVLVAVLACERNRAAQFHHGFAQTSLVAILAFIATANFYPWTAAAATGDLFAIGSARLIDHFKPRADDQPKILADGAINAIEYARRRGGGAIVLFDVNKLMLRESAGTGWTPVNNLANYEPLPSSVISRYIHQGAMAHCRQGWLVVDEVHYQSWALMFQVDYLVTEQRQFDGGYSAYHLIPRRACPAR
jgi:hypothetical protein